MQHCLVDGGDYSKPVGLLEPHCREASWASKAVKRYPALIQELMILRKANRALSAKDLASFLLSRSFGAT
jgi:hypothetical protein